MTNNSIIIKSKGRRFFRIICTSIVAMILLFYGISYDVIILILLGGIICFIVLIELLVHNVTIIELNSIDLIVKYSKVSGLIKDEYKLNLNDIQSSHFKERKYDSGMVLLYPLWELCFPSNNSSLIIYTRDGKLEEIPLNVNEKDLRILLDNLPHTSPTSSI